MLDDDPTTVQLVVEDASAGEGGTDTARISVRVGRALVSGESLEVPLRFSGGVLGTDFTLALQGTPAGVALAGGTVTFTGPSAEAPNLLLTALDDGDLKDDLITVSIPASSSAGSSRLVAAGLDGGAVGSVVGTGRIQVTDDDRGAPSASFARASGSAVEGSGARPVRVVLSPAPSSAITVGYSVGGTAASGDDYAALPGTVAVAPGATGMDIPVSIINDAADEIRETVVLTLAAGEGYRFGGIRVHTLTIIDDDDPPHPTPVVRIAGDGAVAEGGTATFTLSAAPAPASAITVNVLVRAGGGVAPSGQTGSRQVTVGASGRASLTVVTVNDGIAGTSGRVTASVQVGRGYSPHNTADSATVGVSDSGAAPDVGGGDNRAPAVALQIGPKRVAVGEVVAVDISGYFRDPDQQSLDHAAESASPDIAAAAVDPAGVCTLRGVRRGVTAVTITAADRFGESVSQTFRVTVVGPALVPLFPRASDPALEGFVRVVNHSSEDGEVVIGATDDTGAAAGPVTLALASGTTVHFNSGDLEEGNAAKGLPVGIGPGEGDWRLTLDSDLDFEVLAYIRTLDGFLTAMHDVAPVRAGSHRVAFFNPASNENQVSRLRIVNSGGARAEVSIAGVDDAGASPGTAVTFGIPAGRTATLTASDLERGTGLAGALGAGAGKWRLAVASDRPVMVMSLLASPTGHLSNLSTAPRAPAAGGSHAVPMFPSASDPLRRQGFVRVANRSDAAGLVSIMAYDDGGIAYGPVTLALEAGRTRHFNSDDLELGNPRKGLAGSTGSGTGDWRLALSSDLDLDVLAYVRTEDGFLTSMHDVAPNILGERHVAIFNPGKNRRQVSGLRLANPGDGDALVTVTGIDDAGTSPGGAMTVAVRAGAARAIAAVHLEAAAFGGGAGKWRLAVASDRPVMVMSLLASPTGHLTNLSTAPDRGGSPAGWTDPAVSIAQ